MWSVAKRMIPVLVTVLLSHHLQMPPTAYSTTILSSLHQPQSVLFCRLLVLQKIFMKTFFNTSNPSFILSLVTRLREFLISKNFTFFLLLVGNNPWVQSKLKANSKQTTSEGTYLYQVLRLRLFLADSPCDVASWSLVWAKYIVEDWSFSS